jgi:hypothetical protein
MQSFQLLPVKTAKAVLLQWVLKLTALPAPDFFKGGSAK